ncbi:NAD dependent epimerase/dehydratase [Pochonia chlamydosporia 170]|uniref:NAD dependent epimerase/dehydratase n=1 Tax=Pochonia chlamydosporia 170 TaxID=1380566 RepID=A0A179FL44_METCM|nr:NAD dependent epimerase/dehydratase [Pochonia chlamydosporia 170]OAQ66302.1 NAD dependent epimerase/dehydratase [Pochonia chlamydosporia 170]
MLPPDSPLVLVTGGSGFVASHLIVHLLKQGYTVRTTIRSHSKEAEVRQAITHAGVNAKDRLTFIIADLTKDEGWSNAMKGCSFVHHVASPFPSAAPKDENDLIRPAKEGTLRVLRFARDAGVQRVVFTSSFAAIGYGHVQKRSFTEEDWSVLDGEVAVPAYHKSKILAEKAAWGFVNTEGGSLELSVINPTGIFGPVLSKDYSSSIEIIKNMMVGNVPACPRISFGVVDVRDLADLHIRAMVDEAAKGQRFIATCDDGPASMIGIANMVRKHCSEFASKLPSREIPNFVFHVVALFRSGYRGMLPELGVVKRIHNEKAKTTLGWVPRSIEECICDTADSLVAHGVV